MGSPATAPGVALPLEPDVLARIAPGIAGRPGIVSVFAPRRPRGNAAARALVERALSQERLTAPTWRTVPSDPGVLGPAAAAGRPAFLQAIVERPVGVSDARFERRLVLARRRMETVARSAGAELAGFAIPSASARTVVYKGLVAGDRLAGLFPDLAPGIALSHVVFHQRYATNTHPRLAARPALPILAHNGEINTVRGNREQVRGRTADRVERPGSLAGRLLDAGPLISPDGSDSLSFDEALELLVLTGWTLEAALLALVPEAPAMRVAGHPLVSAFGRRVAGFVGPWDGPAAIVFRDGVGSARCRPQRAATDILRDHRRPARRGGLGGRVPSPSIPRR